MKRGAFSTSTITTLIVGLIVILGVAVPVAISVVTNAVNPTFVANESQTVANNSYVTLSHYPIDLADNSYNGVYAIINATGVQLNSTGATANYTLLGIVPSINANGTIWFNNLTTGTWGTTAKISYFYQQTGFTYSQVNQVVLQILPLALGVMAIVLVFVVIQGEGTF